MSNAFRQKRHPKPLSRYLLPKRRRLFTRIILGESNSLTSRKLRKRYNARNQKNRQKRPNRIWLLLCLS
ncbi:hypothetical protein COOONC_25663 [Cooperia oncophora]